MRMNVRALTIRGLVAGLLAAGLTATGVAAEPELVVAAKGKTEAVVIVSPEAGLPESKGPDGTAARGLDASGRRNHEWLAAADLVKYIGLMTGAKPRLVATREAIDAALKGKAPVLLVGAEALRAKPDLAQRIRAAAKPNPLLVADAIGLLREGNRVYLAGNNDESHYYAVAELLRRWGCRWYLPTDFGECIPEVATLTVGALDYAYGSPFEIRSYWISWNGDNTGRAEFQRRNMMTSGRRGFPQTGHALGQYTSDVPGPKARSTSPSPRRRPPRMSRGRSRTGSPRARASPSAWRTASTSRSIPRTWN